MKSVVVLPTYEERENIQKILTALLKIPKIHVLVVDDNSPDGTADIVRKNMKKTKRVHLLEGEKQGLGVAYARGLQHAVKKLKADIVLEMDADFSHDPKDVPRLIQTIEDGADFAIGSRYVSGGRIIGWNLKRRAISWGANMIARFLGDLWQVRDTTAGFRAMKSWVVKKIDWNSFTSRGYAFQVRLLFEARERGAVVREVPVMFQDREKGETKLRMRDMVEFFMTAVELWFHTQFGRFLTVGASGILINWLLFVLLFDFLGLSQWYAIAVGIELSILWNFYLNDSWTFQHRRNQPLFGRMLKYHYTSVGGAIVTLLVFLAFMQWSVIIERVAYFFSIIAAALWNFFLSSRWAWKN